MDDRVKAACFDKKRPSPTSFSIAAAEEEDTVSTKIIQADSDIRHRIGHGDRKTARQERRSRAER